ncbi:S41 family peptidase [Singulisphaera rosea]
MDNLSELVSINGRPMTEWLETLGRYASAERPYMTGALLEAGFANRLWFAIGRVDTFRLGVKLGDGAVRELEVTAAPAGEISAAANKMDGSREFRWLSDGVAYMRPGVFFNLVDNRIDMDTTKFSEFLDGAFREMIAKKARDLIIDLRDDPGGDNSFSDLLIARLAEKPSRFCSVFRMKMSRQTRASIEESAARAKNDPKQLEALAPLVEATRTHKDGERFELPPTQVRPQRDPNFRAKVYVPVNRHSDSMSTCLAAQLQDDGIAKVLGEETSDLPTSFAAIVSFTLPNTKVVVSYPKAHFVRPNGDQTIVGVVPDFAIKTPTAPPKEELVLAEAVAYLRTQR